MRQLFTTLFVCLFLSSAVAQSIIYVTPTGSGNQSGEYWWDAISGIQLQSRLASASAGTQFWITGGRYSPGVLRTATFQIPSGVQVYGGFIGNESHITQRQLSNPSSTTFTGETGDPSIIGDNNRHVVSFTNVSPTTRLDGVVVAGGNADGAAPDNAGGGIYNLANSVGNTSQPVIANCWLVNNAGGYGGGFYNEAQRNTLASPRIIECTFEKNKAIFFGGGLCSSNSGGHSNLSIVGCVFVSNQANTGGAAALSTTLNGGAASNIPSFTECIFSNNKASNGGALYIGSGFSAYMLPSITNSLFIANDATNTGGAVALAATVNCTNRSQFTNCTLVNNSAPSGSGFYSSRYSDTELSINIKNSIIRGGSDRFVYDTGADKLSPVYSVSYSDVQGGFTGTGNIDADPQFVDAANGNFRLKTGSPAINAGDPVSTTATVSATDLDGNQRIAENRIDMGVYELQVSAVTGSDLSLRLNVDSRTPSANQAVTYQLTVTNDGLLKATGVT